MALCISHLSSEWLGRVKIGLLKKIASVLCFRSNVFCAKAVDPQRLVTVLKKCSRALDMQWMLDVFS